MGRITWCAVSLLLFVSTWASPNTVGSLFSRSVVETVPQHEEIAPPIRASVESIPLRRLYDGSEGRLPLRDAVEKRPISLIDRKIAFKTADVQDINTIHSVLGVKDFNKFYGAASYLNNSSKTDERLQHGNANLQEMQQTSGATDRRLVVCYMQSWAAYRSPPLAFTAGLLPRSCTHLHYAFAAIHPHTYAVIPANEDYDIVKGGYRITTGLKQRIPGLRVIISVGGEGTERLFSEIVQKQNRRSLFIDSAVSFLREHDFDGMELNWAYPGEKDDKEKELLTSLLYELREKFSSYGLLLSTVLPPFRYQIEDGYDLRAVSGASDYTVLQAWDMTHEKKDEPPSRALHHSTLHRDPGAASRDQRYENIEFIVKYIVRLGMAADKLVLGVPLFARSYTLAPSTLPSPGAQVTSWGEEGQYTQTKGLLAYFEVCMAEREGRGSSGVDEAGNAYAVFNNQWISFDSSSTVLEKMRFVISSGLAGAAAWAIDMDDFRGLCGSPFPILSTISTSLNGQSVQSDQSTLKIGTCESDEPYLASDEDSCAHFHFCSGGINYRMVCEEERLYDPSTGFCGHQDVAKCLPGQRLRISVNDAERFLSQVYENDFEWNGEQPIKDLQLEHLLDEYEVNVKKNKFSIINRHGKRKRMPRALPSRSTRYNKYPVWDTSYRPQLIIKKPTMTAPNIAGEIKINEDKENDKKVVCYMTSWAFYRRGDGKFVPEHIDTRLCTHVIYAYASLTPDDLVAKEFDPWADITNNLYERVTSLKDVKVLLGLGGWTDSSGDKYSRLVSSYSARTNFIEKLIPFLKMHNFNGLHLDWDYPVCWQSNCKKGAASDKPNFAKFLEQLSKALHAVGMELGVGISGYKEVIEAAYDLPIISKAVDYMGAMTYDYHGGWESSTAHHTPLVPDSNDALPHYSIEYAIKALINSGADPKKLLLGLSFYGQSYRLSDVEGPKGPGAPAAGPGEPGEFTKQPGMLAYYEICYRVKNLRWKTGQQTNAGPYTYSDSQWVGYDDPKSITQKVEWAMRQGLGGVTAWAIDLDDFNNRCCGEPSPLLRAAGRALGRAVPAPPSACERPPPPVTPAPPTTTTVAADGSAGGGDHGSHGNHDQHTSTTWPNWTPAATTPTTAQTWWSPATTPAITTTTPATTTTSTTTTTTTTTERPTTSQAPSSVISAGNVEGESCKAGEYGAAPGDCGSYLQCEGGQWRKHRCAPGLHWSQSTSRCDWPSFAKCTEKPTNEASTATTTLAPMTSRPPPKPTTTTTTTERTTTTSTTTTTTTTSTPPPTTSTPALSDDPNDGSPCSQAGYQPTKDCNSYLHCDGNTWHLQSCAPGLHWSSTQNQCDWPKYAKCKSSEASPTTSAPKPTRPPPKPITTTPSTDKATEEGVCGPSEMHAPASSCDAYLLCVSGRWRKQMCPPGLHWDRRTNRCDWVDFAMCEDNQSATKSPIVQSTTRKPMTNRPASTDATTIKQPAMSPIEETHKPSTGCLTGTYHAHPKCEKFFVCVNDMLVAQSCAPGLVWRPDRTQCDFPSTTSCTDRRQIMSAAMTDAKPDSSAVLSDEMPVSEYCENGQYARLPTDCTRYQHCIFGRYEEFSCSAGLHWNEERQICDWPHNAKCKAKDSMPMTTIMTPTTASISRPLEPSKPVAIDDGTKKPSTVTQPIVGSKPALLNSRYKLVCYYTNWSWYRPGLGKYTPEDIDPTLCTHIVYGFAVLGSDGLIMAHDSWSDYDNRFYERVVEYKRYGIKVSLALGGWNDSAGGKYSKLVNDPAARAKFIAHAVPFLERYGFEGLDLDWEYPKCWQVDCSKGPNSDKQNFGVFVRELSAVLKPKGMLLSSAVSPSKMVIDAGYDVPVLAKYLDWIAVMTYDYHGQWDKKTGHVAPLYYHPDDDNTYFNANYTIHYWLKKGAPSSKLVLGMPMYGQSFTIGKKWDNRNNGATGLNTPASDGGEPGEYTRAKGFLAYFEICDRIRNGGWQVVKDPEQRMGPYAFKGNQWVGFDDVDIIKRKVNFIKSLNLAGGMIWALDLDDFRNRCGEGKHPLLNAIKNGLLDPKVEEIDTDQNQPMQEPTNSIDEDLDDIMVPIYHRPTKKPAMQITAVTTTPEEPTNPSVVVTPIKEERYKVVCYYTNWAWYRPDNGKYTPSDIDPNMCTHIVYAFAVLDKEKLVIKSHDIWLDVENKFYEKVSSLKSTGVKVLLGLGGWDDSAGDKYSRLVNNASARRKFVVHVLDFLEQFGFDGLDLDWEYPKCWQVECEKGPYSDKQGFADLVKELRVVFSKRSLLLSAAVSASKRVIDFAYDVPTLSKNLDWIALMAYDYHGQWDKKTGHVAPMYVHENDADMTLNVNYTVHYWMKKGADPLKLVLGVPFYGQSFSLVEGAGTDLGTPTYAGGEAGDETRARGFLSFYEICDRIKSKGWRVVRDPGGRMGPYATFDDQWVSFDDDVMARHKAEYVRAMGLGGNMVWSLDLDDFTGRSCGCGKSPLLANINHVLRGQDAPPPCSLKEIQGASPMLPATTTEISEPEYKPAYPQSEVQHDYETGSTLEDKPCSGITFRADDVNCAKYYICNNGRYIQLTCPAPLVWHKNHCDWPEKSECKSKSSLRITGENKPENDAVYSPILACYYTNWAFYRHGNGSFGPEQVDPAMCTHIVYSWAHLDYKTYKIVPGNPELDTVNDFYGKITSLRSKGVKVIVGVGGIEDSEDEKWAEMASNPSHRKSFVQSVLKFLKRWEFDGLQIAWQYPVCKQMPCTDFDIKEKDDFSSLLVELSEVLRLHNYELSAMVSSSPEIAGLAYDPEVLAATLDWISLAANDYYASSTGRTAYLVPLETNEYAGINSFNTSLAHWSSVVPPNLLVVGVPAYARSYTLRSSARAGINAPTTGPGLRGHYTRVPGFLAYYEICPGSPSGWKETRTVDGTYAVRRSQWASYLRAAEVHRVAASAAQARLRGAALWALDLDDWRRACGDRPRPLLTALRQGLLEPDITYPTNFK